MSVSFFNRILLKFEKYNETFFMNVSSYRHVVEINPTLYDLYNRKID